MKRLTFAIFLSITIMVGAASAQSVTQVKQYLDYYTQLVEQWTNYRDNTVALLLRAKISCLGY